MDHLANAKRVLDLEAASLLKLKDHLDEQFTLSTECVLASKGKLVVCGMGKSGHIGQKIAATLASTGTPSFFVHPGEAFHGDLGMIGKEDVVLLISFSGETDEVLKIIPFLQWNGNKIIGMSGNPASTLARYATYHLTIAITQEACPLALAPTSSTTATLALGDALAVALMEARNFKPEDFARFHPGGSLGRKLLSKVGDFARTHDLPFIPVGASSHELVLRMSEGRLGMVIVQDKEGALLGIITDGDLRRALMNNPNFSELKLEEIMTREPLMVAAEASLSDAEALMLERRITTLLVTKDGKVFGVLQLYQA